MKRGNDLGNLQDYVKLYDKILDDQTCDDFLEIIKKANFERIESDLFKFKQTIITDDMMWHLDDMEVDENEASPLHIQDIFSGLFFSAATNYFQDTELPLVPELEGFENIGIKKFESGDFYKLHSDVNDYKSAKRFLSVMIFLENTDNCAIRFSNRSICDITPVRGSILVFPPHWLFPYEVVCRDDATMMYAHSYLHYV